MNMADKIKILDVNIDNITMTGAVRRLLGYLKSSGVKCVYTPNPEFIMTAQKDNEFKKILNEADLVVPDGIGIVIASKIIKKRLPERVAGYDMLQNLFKEIKDKDYNVYMFGAAPGVAELAADKMRNEHNGINIVGTRNGYFKDHETKDIIKDINDKKTDILLVGFGAPKQEKWIYDNKDKLDCKICVGIGGSLDGMAGTVKRAPIIFQKLGLEWFYRLLRQPTRIKRMIKLPLFIIDVYKHKYSGGGRGLV